MRWISTGKPKTTNLIKFTLSISLFLLISLIGVQAAALECNESDGGASPQIKGYCKDSAAENSALWHDYCVGSSSLIEYYCFKNLCKPLEVHCDYGCSDGKCNSNPTKAKPDLIIKDASIWTEKKLHFFLDVKNIGGSTADRYVQVDIYVDGNFECRNHTDDPLHNDFPGPGEEITLDCYGSKTNTYSSGYHYMQAIVDKPNSVNEAGPKDKNNGYWEKFYLNKSTTSSTSSIPATSITTSTSTTSTSTTTILYRTPPCDSYGDVNDDGFVTVKDLQITMDHIGNKTWKNWKRADVNDNNKVDYDDAVMINRYTNWKITTFPVCNKTTTTSSTTTTSTSTTTTIRPGDCYRIVKGKNQKCKPNEIYAGKGKCLSRLFGFCVKREHYCVRDIASCNLKERCGKCKGGETELGKGECCRSFVFCSEKSRLCLFV